MNSSRSLDLVTPSHSSVMFRLASRKSWVFGVLLFWILSGSTWAANPEPPERVRRFSRDEYEATLRYWAQQHPGMVTLEQSGRSEAGLGIFLLKITDSAVDDRDKQVALVTSLHGGPERSGSTTALHFVEWLLGDTPEAGETRQKQIVLVMPINHPEAFFHTDRFRNSAGIDPYTGGGPQHWDLARLQYKSSEQAPEVQALLNVVDRWKPEVHVDLHGTGLQEYPEEKLGDRTRYQGQTMIEVTGSAYSNFALRPWDWRVMEAMIRAGEAAGYPSDRFEADAQRSFHGPVMDPMAERTWPGRIQFYTAQYGYAKYHTMVSALEIGWEQSGVARVRGLLSIGNQRWQDEPHAGYPVDRVQSFIGHYVTSYGRTAEDRRQSRVELWQRSGQFTQAVLYPQTDGRDSYFVATSLEAADSLQKELDSFLASIAQQDNIDFESFHRVVRSGPEIQLAVAPAAAHNKLSKETEPLPPIRNGIGFRLRLPYREVALDSVRVNGQPLPQNADHGYQSWFANGFTQVQVNLPPDVAARQDLFMITCEYTPSEKRRIGWVPPREVLEQLRSD